MKNTCRNTVRTRRFRQIKGGLEVYGNTGMACFCYFPVAGNGNTATIWREKTATGTGIWVKSVREKRENGKITVHLRETGEKNTGQNFFYKLKTPKQKKYIQNGSGKSHAPHFGAFAADIFLIPPLLNLNT